MNPSLIANPQEMVSLDTVYVQPAAAIDVHYGFCDRLTLSREVGAAMFLGLGSVSSLTIPVSLGTLVSFIVELKAMHRFLLMAQSMQSSLAIAMILYYIEW